MQGVSSDVVVVDNYHPRWEETAQKFAQSTNARKFLEKYAERISEWADTPINLEFTLEYGLTHICIAERAGLDLWPDDKKYRVHNIHHPQDALAVTAVITQYTNNLMFLLKD